MAWFQRERDSAAGPSDPDPGEQRAGLLADLAALRRYLNQSAGKLPAVSTVTAHQIGDLLHAVVDSAGDRQLDAYIAVRSRSFLTDYVPTTIRTFLTVVGQVDAPKGSAASENLQEQLMSLLDEAHELLAGVRSRDSDALLAQGAFLRTKFTRSDLDL